MHDDGARGAPEIQFSVTVIKDENGLPFILRGRGEAIASSRLPILHAVTDRKVGGARLTQRSTMLGCRGVGVGGTRDDAAS